MIFANTARRKWLLSSVLNLCLNKKYAKSVNLLLTLRTNRSIINGKGGDELEYQGKA